MLEELDSAGDRLAKWADENKIAVLGTGAVILALAGGYGGFAAWSGGRADAASDALAEARREFMVAMGGDPGALDVPEPANPEAAVRIRTRYMQEFQRLASEHAGTGPGALAAMEAGDLQDQLGQREGAIETWTRGVDDLGRRSALRGLLLLRVASAQEDKGDWLAAADAYRTAGEIEAYPLRFAALGDAARCYAEAGETDRALELFDRIEAEAPGARLPDHVRQRLRELRAASSG